MRDERSIQALGVAEKYINGKATEEEIRNAVDDARDAVNASSRVVGDAYTNAAYAAYVATDVATDAALYSVACVATAAADARNAMREVQKAKLLEIVNKG